MPLSEIRVTDGRAGRRIVLYEGDLASLPPEHGVDLLVLSAFPDDYLPTQSSVIGALLRTKGLSVAALAEAKAHDLRQHCAFWLSQPLSVPGFPVGRIACFETTATGPPTGFVGDLFRGLFPFLDPEREQRVAMPLLAAGDQGWPREAVLQALLDAATHWLSRGLAVTELKIVVLPDPRNRGLVTVMERVGSRADPLPAAPTRPPGGGVFLSYASADRVAAELVEQHLGERGDAGTIFNFRTGIDIGTSWQREIDKAIAGARALVALITPDYMSSPECQEELMIARLRHKQAGPFLLPLWWRGAEASIDLWLRATHLADCREADPARLRSAVGRLALP